MIFLRKVNHETIKMFSWHLLFALVIIQLAVNTECCPIECICKWKNGKQSASCVEKYLSAIPTNLDGELQVLDLSKNNLQVLHREVFLKSGLINLQKLFLSQCRIQKIDDHAFKALMNLVELDISENYLTVIPYGNFHYFPSLMRLILNENPITVLKSHGFQNLIYLNTLEISYCKLDTIEPSAFSGLNNLEWLRLDGNKLSYIAGDSNLPDSLKGIELQNNDWNCNCELIELHRWISNFNIPQNVEPVCVNPKRLSGQTIKSIKSDELACPPVVSPTMLQLQIDEGKNITLECFVSAVPQAKVSWWFDGQILQNDTVVAPGLHLLYFIESGTKDKKSELMIYSANAADNGTYTCLAENFAGSSQANYSVKVILKETPKVIVVTFPYKYLIFLLSVLSFVFVVIFIIVIIAVIKCRRDSRSRKKKESGVQVALRNQNTIDKLSAHMSTDERIPSESKANGNLNVKTQFNCIHYQIPITREINVNGPNEVSFSPNSLRNYVENNPDLIHDTQTVDTMKDLTQINQPDASDSKNIYEPHMVTPQPIHRQVTWQDQQQQQCSNNLIGIIPRLQRNDIYQYPADIHLNPGYYLDPDGYPVDYGLPKINSRVNLVPSATPTPAYYQTLPHNKRIRRTSHHYAKDNEFNNRGCPLYGIDVRYTVDGYPFNKNECLISVNPNMNIQAQEICMSLTPEQYETEPFKQIQTKQPLEGKTSKSCYHLQTRCENTQTTTSDPVSQETTIDEGSSKTSLVAFIKCKQDPSTESPDEGYVGDGNESSDI